MRYAAYDYTPVANNGGGAMPDWWDGHWKGRGGLRSDEAMREQPLWPTICDRLIRPGRLLEAGCGTGQWVRFFRSLGHDAVGVDFATSGLNVGRAFDATLDLRQADFRALPFAEGSFDYVTSFGAVEHDPDGPEPALREFRRVLKPHGWLMCSVPCLNAWRLLGLPWMALRDWLKRQAVLRRIWGKTQPFVFHQYMWTPQAYRGILRRCGFKVVAMRGYGRVGRSRLFNAFDRVMALVSRLSSAHMMMAICRKA